MLIINNTVLIQLEIWGFGLFFPEMGNHLKLGGGEVTQGQDPGHDHQDKAKIASMYFNFKITCF